MKTHLLYPIAAFAAFISVFGCQKPVEEKPSLELSRTEVTVPSDGGTTSVAYRILNPVAGAEISVEQPDADWISGLTISDSEISFYVAANETAEERSEDIAVSYPGLSADCIFTVIQEAGEPAPFEITLKENNASSYVVDIIPLDKEMYYVAFGTTQAYLDQNGLDTDEALYQDDLVYFNGNLGFRAVHGDQINAEYECSPATDNVLYVYGIDPETSERITDIVYERFTSASVEMEDVQFSINNLEVEGSMVTFSVDPGSYDGYWSAFAYETSKLESEVSMYDYCSSSYAQSIEIYKLIGYPDEDILEETCLKGPQEGISFNTLEPGTAYTIAVFAVNDECLVSSDPTIANVTTGVTEPSDNKLEVTVTDITATGAHLEISTTNDDSYAYLVCEASELEGKSDEEIMEYAISYYNLNMASGDVSRDIADLPSSEDFSVLAFGYEGGAAPTTGLARADFRTLDAEVGTATIELICDNYYEIGAAAEALADVHPDMAGTMDFYASLGLADAVIPIYVSTSSSEYYYSLLTYDEEEYNDDGSISSYLIRNTQAGTPGSAFMTYFGKEQYFAAVAVDENGNAGPVFKTEPFILTPEGVSNDFDYLIEFITTYYGDQAAAAALNTQSTMPDYMKLSSRSSNKMKADNVYTGSKEAVAISPDMFSVEVSDEMQNKIDHARSIMLIEK